MTDSQLTQCPHCKASFKVSEEQLNAANGRVRCGACLNIFDAIAYQITSPTQLKKNTNKDLESLNDDFSIEPSTTVDLSEELLDSDSPTELSSDEDTIFADDPEEDKLEQGYSGSAKFSDELSSSFLELETSNSDSFKTQFLSDDANETLDNESVDESWASSILEDLDDPENKKIEPNFSLDETIDELAPSSPEESEAPVTENEPAPLQQKDLNEFKFQYEQDPAPKKKWLLGTILFLANASLLVLLIVQAGWFHYEKLVKYPKIASAYSFACSKLGCTLPVLSDITKIENRSLVVRSHPTTFNALIIETIITNHANFEQDFPNISLTFSNINNQVIAQRLFQPSEYLSKEILEWNGMPPEQPIQITLEIIDPGAEAVNYKMNFHLPQSSNIDQQADQMSTNKSKI